MNPFTRFVWICLLLHLSSCNSFTDQQPEPDNGPPTAMVQAILQYYPQAQDIRFNTIRNNQLWKADFAQKLRQHQAFVAPTELLSVEQLLPGNLADSLAQILNLTVMPGGTITRPRTRIYEKGWSRHYDASDPSMYQFADYTWQQQRYTAYWSIAGQSTGKPWYNFKLMPYQQTSYTTSSLADLPESVQQTLRQENLTFTGAWVQIDADGNSHYDLSVNRQSQYCVLTLTEDGKIIAVDDPYTAQFFQEFSQLPAPIQAYLQRPELAGFDLARKGGPSNAYGRHTFGSLVTYQISVEKGKQAWDLEFTEDGQLIRRTYRLYGSF